MKRLCFVFIMLFFSGLLYATELPVVHLRPKVQVLPLPGVDESFPYAEIGPFLDKSRVIETNDFAKMPIVVGNTSKRVLAATGDQIYVKNLVDNAVKEYIIVQPNHPYVDPKSKKILGYPAIYKGTAVLEKKGPIATLTVTEIKQEIQTGDRLMPAIKHHLNMVKPRVPNLMIQGHILDVFDGISQLGKFDVVVIDRGWQDGIRIGDQFKILQLPNTEVDQHYAQAESLPKFNVGKLMVFRAFQNVSFALITSAVQTIHISDQFISEKKT